MEYLLFYKTKLPPFAECKEVHLSEHGQDIRAVFNRTLTST
jgi:hypothetical protein